MQKHTLQKAATKNQLVLLAEGQGNWSCMLAASNPGKAVSKNHAGTGCHERGGGVRPALAAVLLPTDIKVLFTVR
jgi:hypothetical protein